MVIAAALAIPSIAMQGDTIADRVLGQVDFVHSGLNLIDAGGILNPQAVAIDSSVTPNRLYVADTGNSRVLGYRDVTTFVNGGAADLVIGQSDFSSGACNEYDVASASRLCDPAGVAVDASGNLYVADSGNARVLEYNTPFVGCGSFPCVGGAANLVLGQGGSFTSDICNLGGVSADSMCDPVGVTVDAAGNLYVADQSDNRVLEYNTPLASDTTADLVFGQSGSFGSSDCNLGGASPSASSLCGPEGVAVDAAGDLYVADNTNNRVLEYNTPLTSGTTAEAVFGQGGSFTSGDSNSGGLSASSLSGPAAVTLDAGGNLYVADDNNNRVLEYNTPLSSDTVADAVFGQAASFTSNGCNLDGMSLSADSLCSPAGVVVDSDDNLYVADHQNNRVLKYNTPLNTDTTADVVLGQLDFSHNGEDLIDGHGFNNPGSVAVDTSITPNRLYVADSANARVLGYKDVTAFANGGAADLVIGQPDFLSGACNQNNSSPSASSLCNPFGIAVDASGNLYVADRDNNRVLEYDTPFAGCGSFPCVGGDANRVFGQGDVFTSNTCNNGGLGAGSLCNPSGVAVDSSGNLYVADFNNNRVLEYDTPLSSDTTADRVFGQAASFTSGDCNQGNTSASAGSLCLPIGVAVDGSNDLYIADFLNSRVLEYKTPLATDVPDLVLGQSDLVSGGCNHGGVAASTLCNPNAVAVDASNNLYVADGGNSRVLQYSPPLAPDAAAGVVFGQGNSFTSGDCDFDGLDGTADNLCAPSGVAVDDAGNLYVADTQNYRVLEYDKPVPLATPTPTATAGDTPTATATAIATSTATATATSTPTATATATATATVAATATATATPTATPTPTGEGLEELVVNPSRIDFGTVSVGTTSAAQTVTMTNDFNDDTVDFFAGYVAANYVETGSTCGSTLGPLQSCQLDFACKPKTTGSIFGFYAFLYGSWDTSGLMDGDDFRRIDAVVFTCTGG